MRKWKKHGGVLLCLHSWKDNKFIKTDNLATFNHLNHEIFPFQNQFVYSILYTLLVLHSKHVPLFLIYNLKKEEKKKRFLSSLAQSLKVKGWSLVYRQNEQIMNQKNLKRIRRKILSLVWISLYVQSPHKIRINEHNLQHIYAKVFVRYEVRFPDTDLGMYPPETCKQDIETYIHQAITSQLSTWSSDLVEKCWNQNQSLSKNIWPCLFHKKQNTFKWGSGLGNKKRKQEL